MSHSSPSCAMARSSAPTWRSHSHTALSLQQNILTHSDIDALPLDLRAHHGFSCSPVASAPYSFTEQSATPHAFIQVPFARSASPNFDIQNIGERPLSVAQHEECALQGTLENLQQVDGGFRDPSCFSLLHAGLRDPFMGLLGSLHGHNFEKETGISGFEYTTGEVQVPIYDFHHGLAAEGWQGASSPLEPYGGGAFDTMTPTSDDLWPETIFPSPSNVPGMTTALGQRFWPLFSDSASTHSDWNSDDVAHDHGSILEDNSRMPGQMSSPIPPASLIVPNASSCNTIIESQEPQTVSVLDDAPPTPSIAASKQGSTHSYPPCQDPPSRPIPGYPKKPRKPRSKCTRCNTTLSRSSDLNRHMNTIHRHCRPQCSVPGCTNNQGRGFSRPDKFAEHMRTQHRERISQGSV